MSRFVTELRSPGTALRLADAQGVAAWTVRVQCAEVWDTVKVEVTPETRVRDVKRAAMAQLMPDAEDVDGYVVKLHGFEVRDEQASLQAAGCLDGSTLLVMSRRRRPVR